VPEKALVRRRLLHSLSASGAFEERRILLLAASMLKQEELAFLKAISAVRQSPARLQELRKTLSANKDKRAVALRKVGGSAGPSTRRQQEIKRKASHLGLDTSGEPATRRPAPEITFVSGSCVLPPTDGQAAHSCQQPQRPSYSAVVARRATLPQIEPLKHTAMESDSSDTSASSEAANRRMSQDISGPLSGTPAGTTSAASNSAAPVPAGQRRNRTPVF
jgi:hypothetical protein